MTSGSYLIRALAGKSHGKLSGHIEFTFGSQFGMPRWPSDRFLAKNALRERSGPKRVPPTDSFSPNTIDAAGIVVQLLNAF